MARPLGTVKYNLTGKTFGRYLVIKQDLGRKGATFWICQCECGKIKSVSAFHLMKGIIKSCGCYHKEEMRIRQTIHGRSEGDRTHRCWSNMIQRCTNPNNHHFYLYGARGIKVCSRWLTSFVNFLNDMGDQPEGYQIERKDNNGDYEPENCIWLKAEHQASNKRYPKLRINKKSGLPKGVTNTKNGKYVASITIRKKYYYLGVFKSVSEAVEVLKKIRKANNILATDDNLKGMSIC